MVEFVFQTQTMTKMFRSAVSVFLLLVGASATTATRKKVSLSRMLQGFQFGGSQQFGGDPTTFSPAPTPSVTLTSWPTSATDDYYNQGGTTSSPWPTSSPNPTTAAERTSSTESAPGSNPFGGGIDGGGGGDNTAAATVVPPPSGGDPAATPLAPGDGNLTTSATAPGEFWTTTAAEATAVPPPYPYATTPAGNETVAGNDETVAGGNATTTPAPIPPTIPGNVVTTNVPTAAPVPLPILATPAPSSGGYDNYVGNDDDFVPTSSPAPTVGDGPEPGYPSWPIWTRTDEPTEKYVPPNDDVLEREIDDEVQKAWEEKSSLEKAEAEWADISHDKNVKIVSIVFGVTGFLLLLFVAHQLIENPDGFFGKLCRCLLACVRIICWPCRFICCRSARARDRRTHQLVNSEPSSYGYSHDLELT